MIDESQAHLDAARRGDAAAFEALVAPYRRELLAHCYRMLGSVHDAEDALQESLLAAWRGLAGFEGRGSLRAWLYRICTNASLRLSSQRLRRILSPDLGPPGSDPSHLGEPVSEQVWLEPWLEEESVVAGPTDADPGDPADRYVRRETLELAFVAALQFLPGRQRAVLLLREVLGFSAAEVAEILETTPASVNSALQRARKAVNERVPDTTQVEELRALGEVGRRELVDSFVAAWERADIDALTALLAEDARFSMPPLPAWFSGRRDVARFFAEGVFTMEWRLVPILVNGQIGFACYVRDPGGDGFRLGAVNALSLRGGRIAGITGWLDPVVDRQLGLAARVPPARGSSRD
ncbi:MAG TPA: sigma-70 family RNA polymerase sigma factor [Candidatus Limnocylindrales bacterium]|nr:sigma-70 family RNA polymerase sigma factor [Candidatus Limnocylindrales bacterium]